MSTRFISGTTFSNKHIVITGGSSGLGLELSRRLIKEGAKLSLIARDTKKLDAAKKELMSLASNAQVNTYSLDVADEQAAAKVMQAAAETFGGIDVLINSAGVLIEGDIRQSSLEDYRYTMEINYFGLINATKAALPHLINSQGKLVNIASIAGLAGTYGYSSYCGSKHAVIGFSDSIRYELKPEGVRVQVVCPGEFDTPMVDNVNAHGRSEENIALTKLVPQASCEYIAQETLKGIRRDDFMIVTGNQAKMAAFNIRHFPQLGRMVGDSIIKRIRKKSA